MKKVSLAVLLACLSQAVVAEDFETCSEPTCGVQVMDKDSGDDRRLAGVAFNTIPVGGWAANSAVSCGLEWIYAVPIPPSDNYYDFFPLDLNGPACSCGDGFPPCVQHSGFRLPTAAEVASCLPSAAPPCMAAHGSSCYSHCDLGDYNAGLIAKSDVQKKSCDETVYVRPVGTNDSCDGGAVGDPHIKTWTGEQYDFHGACDLVLLLNPGFKNGLGMDIHMRTKFTRQWSYIDTAVIRIGDETLEVGGGGDKNRYWINKVANGDLSKGISGFPISFEQVNSKQREFTVDLGGGEAISFKTWKDFVRVDTHNASPTNFGSSLGLMGTYSKGQKLARDNSTIIEDANEFGQEWQVLITELRLFHNLEGAQPPQKCAMPDAAKARRRLRESTISKEDAEIACARVSEQDRDACVFDVLATNDKDVAGAY